MSGAYFHNARVDMLKLAPPRPRRVLEIGCGAGAFSAQIEAEERWGVEPNPAAAAEAETRLTRVVRGVYDTAEGALPDRHFDLVIANDVIEHMPDHDAFLRRIKTKMAPGAALIGSVPNVRALTQLVKLLVLKDWTYTDEGILDRTHLRFFTRKSLMGALAANGYEVEVLTGLNSMLRHGLRRHGAHVQNALASAATAAVVGATLGYYWDVQFPQYGFRVRPR